MWINPTYPIYNWGYNPLTKWDEPPSRSDLGGSPANLGVFLQSKDVDQNDQNNESTEHFLQQMGQVFDSQRLAQKWGCLLGSHRFKRSAEKCPRKTGILRKTR